MDAKYNPKEIEARWYQYWLDQKFFHSEVDSRQPYTVVIPPPNVTGVLHMGHMLNNTIQDILVRRARQEGKNACWVPGTDHASIATEAKVVNKLAQQGIKKTDLTREQFLEHAWDWTREHGGIILKQLRRLGASCDWDRTGFTMDEIRSRSVIRVFCDLYNKGLIYRGVRMVNWDPKALTALSDEEVIFKEHHGKLYYLRYKVEGEDTYAIVATTRPETIMGDTAMCINPNNPKTAWLKGKRVIVPLVNRVIPVIEDDYVDIEFGTGCLKVTPAHDVNDYMLGEKYNLPSIDIFNDNGTLSEAAGLYVGMDRFDCREQIEKDLAAAGLLEKVEDYTNNVGFSERTNVPIEPKLSMQWFLRMEHFAQMALPPVMEDRLKFYPAKYKNTYKHWLENIKDWCISRQLWWGHRIPAYYVEDSIIQKFKDSNIPRVIVAESEEEALQQLQKQCPEIVESLNLKSLNTSKSEILTQDPDCLDTWFSSWLWPISLFNGILDPDNKEINYYYPTADLVTGPDIIFFWVARMIMAGYEYKGEMPFRNVYFTGIVRDKLGRKMSKSLGNSPDPLDLIDRFGADGVRMGMMLAAPAGNDILFDEALCEQGRNFNNKIWNCFRLIKGWTVAGDAGVSPAVSAANNLATTWFAQKLAETQAEVADLFSKYRLSEALMAIYKLFWDEFSSWYLEMIKPAYGQPIDQRTYDLTLQFFDQLLRLLHPFMPFITEELWQNLSPRKDGDTIMFQPLTTGYAGVSPAATGDAGVSPAVSGDAADILPRMEHLKAVITAVRNIRASKNISPKEQLLLQVVAPKDTLTESERALLLKLCNLSSIETVAQKSAGAAAFIAGTTEYAVPLDAFINVEEELQKLEADLKYQEGFLQNVLKKLSNERFVQNAKPEIVAMERKKQSDAESRIAAIKESIKQLQQN